MNRLEHTFHVKFLDFPDLSPRLLAFTGDLELNVPFRLEMELSLSAQELSKIDRKKLLGTDASLSIYDSEHSEKDKHHSAHFIKWCGKIAKIQLIRSYLDSIFILITLESALGALSSLIQNRLYLGKTGPDIVKECLTAEGLVPESILDFSLDRGAYPKREFLLSKNEETLDFALFNLGRDGVSFFSTWNGEEERIVFCDSNTSFIPIMDGDEELEFRVSDPSGLAPNKEPLFEFKTMRKALPQSIRLRDYNWENPTRNLEVQKEVAKWGRGELYLYGEGFETQKEGERLLNIRREELISESVTHEGLSELPGLFPGGIITLEGKGRKLITALSLKAKISSPYSELEASEEDAPGLSARIKFRDLDTPFRPKYIKGKSERKLRAPTSPLTGWIHGEGNGESPEMDGMGRYKVLFPLDISGRRGGKTSSWIRKAAPYVGLGYGEHLPLCPGVEVLVDFMENDPSKPFIVGAVPNGETGNFIHQGSPRAGITSKGGGALIFDNTEAKQAVTLGTGSKRGFVGLTAGSPTKALVECDTDYLLCLLQNNIVGFSEMEQVGWHWGLCSSSGFMSRAFAAFAAFKGLAASLTSAAIRETKDEKGDDEDEPKLPYANDKTLISRYFSLAYFLLGQFMVCVDIISQTQGIVEESPLSYPHLNLLSLCASEDETTADYYAKLPEKNYLLKVLLCLLTMIGIGDMASTLTANEADLDGFKQNADAKHLTEDQKKHTLTAKKISFAQSAIASIIGVISTVMTTIETILEMVQGPAKGLLIENSDSYLSILAETGLALSARTGPTLLESSEHRVAQMLNKFVYEDLIPSHLVKPDLIDATGKGFQGGSAVVLRSTLVKALADEIVLAASMHLIEKCEIGPIALYCGKGSPTTDTPGTKLDLELNESISNISKEGLIQENTSSAEAKNILVQSTSESYPIQLETKKAPSAILLKQEKGELTKVRSLNLSQNNLKLASVKDTFLTLTTTGGASATLALNDKEKLSLTASKASLLTSNGSLEITQDSNTFKHPTKITLAVGKVTMDMESAKVTVANPPRVQVQAPLSSLGG